MRDKDKEYIELIDKHCKEAIKEITMVDSFDEFEKNLIIAKAVCLDVAIIGEHIGKLSDKNKNALSQTIVRKSKDMRNFLVHNYGHIDLRIVWSTVKDDLPLLLEKIHKIKTE